MVMIVRVQFGDLDEIGCYTYLVPHKKSVFVKHLLLSKAVLAKWFCQIAMWQCNNDHYATI